MDDVVKVEKVDIKKLELNEGQIPGVPKNPRLIKDNRYKALLKSVQDDPEMLDLRELLVYPVSNGSKYVTIGGNMRLLACRELKFKTVPCKILPENTPADKLKAYAIKDNIQGGEWDFDMLANDWEPKELVDFGFDKDDLQWFEDIDSLGTDFSLPEGEKSPFKQMTFTLSDAQAEQVEQSLKIAKTIGEFIDTGNENSNGNALARICETFMTDYGKSERNNR